MPVVRRLRGVLPSSRDESSNDPPPFRYQSFRLTFSQDRRLDAHSDRISCIVEEYLNHHIVLRGTDQRCTFVPRSTERYLDLREAESTFPSIAILVG